MKTPIRFPIIAVAALLLAAAQAQAYFDPQIGRWASRDPIEEEAFRTAYTKGKSRAERKWLEREALKPAYVLVQNDTMNRFDPQGLASGNCYMHCTGLPESEPGLAGYRKNRLEKRCLGPYTCARLKEAAIADGLEEAGSDGKCKEGWKRIAYFEGDKKGLTGNKPDTFHFACEDSDGNWSQKLGKNPVDDVDASGNKITDPTKANWDFPQMGLKMCEGYLCAPPKTSK